MPTQVSHDGREGRSCLFHLLKRMIVFYPTPSFLCGTGNWVSKANWTPPAKCGEQNRSTGPSCWHLGKTKGLLDVWCPLVQSSFLPNQSPLAKYWGRQPATLVCQHCESSPGGEKENTFMCWPHPVFPLLSLLLPLPFIFLSVLQDPLLPNLWTCHVVSHSEGAVEWNQLLEFLFLIKW